jgi:hypothetical protein
MMTIMCLQQIAARLFRSNLWREHSWRVQVVIANFKFKNTIQRKDHASNAAN